MLRKLFGTKSLTVISVFVFFALLVSSSQGSCCDEDKSILKLRERVSGDLDVVARELSIMLAQDANRNFFAKTITNAKKRTVGLGQSLGALRVNDPNNIGRKVDSITMTVRKIESTMAELGLDTPRIDVKLPVKAHVKLLKDADKIYVAIAPLKDEKDVDKVIAYSNGKRLELDKDKSPTVPTIVIIGTEPQSSDPGYPIPIVKEPGKEKRERRVDDYIGIPYIYLYNHHEHEWFCGDPEIYVRIKRFRFSTFSVINQRVNLPGVDGEKVWYNLGDRNSTYKYVNTSDYAPVIRFEFWEEDSGFHGSDDHLGSINIWWTNLPFWGYTEYVAGSVKFRVDRD